MTEPKKNERNARIEFDNPERQALFASHFNPMWELELQLDSLKEKKKEMRLIAKAEGFQSFEFDFAIKCRRAEDPETIQDRIRRQIAVARYLAMPIGRQFEFSEADMRPDVDRAFDAGRDSALWGDSLRNPYDQSLPQWKAYGDGYARGQEERREALRKQMEERNAAASAAGAAKAAATVGGGYTPSQEAIDAMRSGAAADEEPEAEVDRSEGRPDDYSGASDFAAETEATVDGEDDSEKPGRTLAGRVKRGGKSGAKLAAVH